MQAQKLRSWGSPRVNFFKRSNSVGPIGLDFGLERLHLVQFDYDGNSKSIRAATAVSYPSDREQVLSSKQCLKSLIDHAYCLQPFSGRNIVSALPPTLQRMVLVNYQCTRNEDQTTALVAAIKDRFGDQLDNAVIDYVPIQPKVEEQVDRSALVVISEHKALTDFLEMLRSVDLNVKALEVGPVAIKRLILNLQNPRAPYQKVMVINFANISSFVTVLWKGDLLLDREINVGLDHLLNEISTILNISIDKARYLILKHGLSANQTHDGANSNLEFDKNINDVLVDILRPSFMRLTEEIRKVMIYTAAETQGKAIDVIYIMGSVARWPGATNYLSKLIKLPVSRIDPTTNFQCSQSSINSGNLKPGSGLAVATGLALRTI